MPTDALGRLQLTRAEIAEALEALRLHPPSSRRPQPDFPRSALLRAALAPNGRLVLGGAAATLLLLRPGLLLALTRYWRVASWLPVARILLNRYLVRRNETHE